MDANLECLYLPPFENHWSRDNILCLVLLFPFHYYFVYAPLPLYIIMACEVNIPFPRMYSLGCAIVHLVCLISIKSCCSFIEIPGDYVYLLVCFVRV